MTLNTELKAVQTNLKSIIILSSQFTPGTSKSELLEYTNEIFLYFSKKISK